MKRPIEFLTTTCVSLLFSAVSGLAGAREAPDEVYIRNLVYAGSGCPAGSVAENVAADKQAFTLMFDTFIAEAGPGVPLRESRKNCQILVDLVFPQGWSYTIVEIDHRGFANLGAGATASQKAAYYFQGEAQTVSLETKLRGPLADDYQVHDMLGLSAQIWSPCGARRALNIKSQVVTTAGRHGAPALITVDSVDGQLTQVYKFQWKRCR
jgi:hypothetical protein